MLLDISNKHLSEQDFFALIRIYEIVLQGKSPDHKPNERFWQFSDLLLGAEALGEIYNRLQISDADIECDVLFDMSPEFQDELDNIKKKDAIKKIVSKIENKKPIPFQELGALSWEYYNIYDHALLFAPDNLSQKIKESLSNRVNSYIDAFINDALVLVNKNYFRFEAQKRMLIQIIQKDGKISLYGNNFIISEQVDWKGVMMRDENFCLVQTVYAMQKLGYLDVVSMWASQQEEDILRGLQKRYIINVNIALHDEFIQEINSSYRKENPRGLFESFDRKSGVLKFAGKSIELSKSGKETDAVLLMNELVQATDDGWLHHDEILEKWGYNLDDQKKIPKNKVYFAGQKINQAVAIKTQIEDFIECNTSKARINPKYRRVDK